MATEKRRSWEGPRVAPYIDRKMRDPEFRIAFSEARARRIKSAIAAAIRHERARHRMSQTTLAKRARTTQAVVSRIENANRPYLPSVAVLARIAIALGTRLEVSLIRPPRAA